jgi:hypothetical protein
MVKIEIYNRWKTIFPPPLSSNDIFSPSPDILSCRYLYSTEEKMTKDPCPLKRLSITLAFLSVFAEEVKREVVLCVFFQSLLAMTQLVDFHTNFFFLFSEKILSNETLLCQVLPK